MSYYDDLHFDDESFAAALDQGFTSIRIRQSCHHHHAFGKDDTTHNDTNIHDLKSGGKDFQLKCSRCKKGTGSNATIGTLEAVEVKFFKESDDQHFWSYKYPFEEEFWKAKWGDGDWGDSPNVYGRSKGEFARWFTIKDIDGLTRHNKD